ncbi:MAG: hypothetical protein HZA09_05315 [Nitrospirae bacterium]|nr:hypothetical protein [Nitrospirota bacterium]
MQTPITIKVGSIELDGELFDTETAKAIVGSLPIEREFSVWGDEFYFEIPVSKGPDQTSTTEVKVGDIGYWPPGRALAIFFGPTPMSRGSEPVPAGKVNLVGRIIGDPKILRSVKGENRIWVSRLNTA